MPSPQIQTLHREIEQLPKVKKFLASIERNSQRTSTGYMDSIRDQTMVNFRILTKNDREVIYSTVLAVPYSINLIIRD